MIDILLWLGLASLATVITVTILSSITNKLSRAYSVENFAESVFRGMDEYYWDNVSQTKCLAPPSVTLTELIDNKLVNNDLSDNTYFNKSSVVLTYDETESVSLPSMMSITIKFRDSDSKLGDIGLSNTYIRSNDESQKTITLSAPFDISPFTVDYMAQFDSTGCME